MNRSDFKKLAEIRLKEARMLLENGCFSGAYYLCGFAVECALKACIAKQTKRYDFPPKERIVKDIYTHELIKLVSVAGLSLDLDREMKSDSAFADKWGVVKTYSWESRYEKTQPEKEARDLYSAIVDRQHGVLRWIKRYW